MAEIDEVINKFNEVAERLLSVVGSSAATSNFGNTIKTTSDRIAELAKEAKNDAESAKKLNEILKKTSDNLVKSDRTTLESRKEFEKSLEEMADKVTENKEEFKANARAIYESSKAEKEKSEAVKTSTERTKRFNDVVTATKNAFEPLGKAVGSVISGYQSSGSQISMASGILQTEMALAGTSAEKAGSSLSGIGQATAGATSKVGKFGSGLASVAGGALTLFGQAANTIASKVLPKLTTEMEMYYKNFNSMSASGAVFSNGLTGMHAAAKEAGLTLNQMSDVLKRNSELIAQTGMGVSGATVALANVSKEMKQTGIQKQLLNLGYSFEEQADLVAETMTNMRKYNQGTPINNAEIAQQTKSYAENLRTISAITGEDAKKKMAQVKEQNNILAFQQQVAKMSPKQQAELDAAMATMTEMEKKNFRERMIFGQVINQEGRIYEATIAGAAEKGQEAVALAQANNLTAKNNAELNAKYGETIRQSALSNESFGKATMVLGGQFEGAGKGMMDAVNQSTVYTKDAVSKGIAGVEGQAGTQDKLTSGMTAVAQAGQDAALKIQDAILKSGVMEEFAKQVKNAADALIGMIDKFGGGAGSAATGILGGIGGIVDKLGGVLAGAGALASIYEVFKKPGGGPGAPTPGGGTPKPGGGGGGRFSRWFGAAKEALTTVAAAGTSMVGKVGEAAKGATLGVAGAAGGVAAKAGEAASGIAGAAGSTAAKIGETAATAGATGAAAGGAAKGATSTVVNAGKSVGKSILKKIPLIGLGIGLWDAAGRLAQGDYAGAAMSAASGAASTIPGAGTLVSAGIDAAQMATDATGLTGQPAVPATPSEPGATSGSSSLSPEQMTQLAQAGQEAIDRKIADTVMKVAGVDVTKQETSAEAINNLNKNLMLMVSKLDEQLDYMRGIATNTRQTVLSIG